MSSTAGVHAERSINYHFFHSHFCFIFFPLPPPLPRSSASWFAKKLIDHTWKSLIFKVASVTETHHRSTHTYISKCTHVLYTDVHPPQRPSRASQNLIPEIPSPNRVTRKNAIYALKYFRRFSCSTTKTLLLLLLLLTKIGDSLIQKKKGREGKPRSSAFCVASKGAANFPIRPPSNASDLRVSLTRFQMRCAKAFVVVLLLLL